MKIVDAFDEIRTGVNLKNPVLQNEGEKIDAKTFKKNALDYGLLLEDKLVSFPIFGKIDNKYFMQPRDIIISTKKPYKVATYPYTTKNKIIIPNNFIVLRGIHMDDYSYIFVTNYLERIAMKKYFKDKTSDLSKVDIEKIELPDIPKVKQMKISELMKNINKRGVYLSNLISNDNEIILYALKKIVGD